MILEFRLSKVGFPIRKSVDQSSFAAPHGLSQRSTSFIASHRQGIHRTPLRHLIALIIYIHPTRQNVGRRRTLDERRMRLDMIRKTSLLRKINPIARRSSFANNGMQCGSFRGSVRIQCHGDSDCDPQIALQIPNSDQSPLYDVRNPAVTSRRTSQAK